MPDSLKTVQLLQLIAANAEQHSSDSAQTQTDESHASSDSSIIQQSEERENTDSSAGDMTMKK
ncbi:MAG: hypothetical protein WDM71_04065 [Ferruginibacter sp.]